MPLYSYHCQDCDTDFEALRPLSERDDALPCPSCGGTKGRRVYKPFSVSVKSSQGGAAACPSAQGCPHSGSCGCH